jgi:hypothetical protein
MGRQAAASRPELRACAVGMTKTALIVDDSPLARHVLSKQHYE